MYRLNGQGVRAAETGGAVHHDVDVEREALWLLERAGYTARDAPGAYAIAVGLLGPDCLVKVSSKALFRGSQGELAEASGHYTIRVSASASPTRKALVTMHEIGHWHLRQIGYRGADVEELCDAIAAALIVPRTALEESLSIHGERWRCLADDFGTSETIVVLRYGEVMHRPVAVFDSRVVYIRGPRYSWPASPEGLRRLAKTTPQIKARRLGDNRRRTALIAASR